MKPYAYVNRVCVCECVSVLSDEWSSEALQQVEQHIISQEVCSRDDWWGHYGNDYTVCAGSGSGGSYVGGCHVSAEFHYLIVFHAVDFTRII